LPDEEPRLEPARVPARGLGLLPEEEEPEQGLAAEPRPAEVARLRGRRTPSAARWLRQSQAVREATGWSVSSWPLSFPCL
jgi:hypothetical protein